MQNQVAIKRAKLIAIVFLLALGCFHLPSEETRASAPQEQSQNRLEIVGVSVPYNERFGADDGAIFVLHFTGDLHGNLARRVSYVKKFKEKFGQTPSLLIDSGSFLADERNSHGELRPDVAVKDDSMFKIYDQFPVDAANVSASDLRYVSRLLRKAEFAASGDRSPLLKRLVSANIVSDSADNIAPQPFIVRELTPTSPRSPAARPVRVAFIGLTETKPDAPRGFKFVDMVEAARRALAEAKKQADVVVALAHSSVDQATRLAREVPGIDAIIVGNSRGAEEVFTPPFRVGQTELVFTPYETRMIGELRFYRDAQGRFSSRVRFITLDELVPDDEAAAQAVNTAREAETAARDRSKKLLNDWLALSRARIGGRASDPHASAESASTYVTAVKCAECHQNQYLRWANTAHAHATDPLVSKPVEFEMGCLACHATGAQNGRGEMARLQSVQCEQCHGPGGDHAAKPAKGYGRISDLKSTCSTCHTPQVDPNFDAQAAWAKIKH
jgi:hypothetical protein